MPVIDAFTVDTTARLTGLSPDRLGAWDRRRFFPSSLGNHERGGVYRRVYSFLDIVVLRTIARLLDLGVSHAHLKKVREALGDVGNEGWINQRLYISGKQVFLSREEAFVAAHPNGQTGDPVILNLRDVWEEVDRGIRKLAERPPGLVGDVSCSRDVLSGETVIAGTRIPVSAVYDMHREGYSTEEIMCEYPRLKPDDIHAAIAYYEPEMMRAG